MPFSITLTIHYNHFILLIGCYLFDMFVNIDFFAVTGGWRLFVKITICVFTLTLELCKIEIANRKHTNFKKNPTCQQYVKKVFTLA